MWRTFATGIGVKGASKPATSKIILLFAAALGITGCSGTLTTTFLAPTKNGPAPLTPGWSGNGVIAYPTAYFKEQYVTTTIVQNGKVIHRSIDGGCSPQTSSKLAALADYARPMLISYSPGLLESYKLGVELNADGSLKSVNLGSTPDQGNTLKNLGSAAASVATPLAARKQTKPAPPCTDGEVLTDLIRYSFPPYTGQ